MNNLFSLIISLLASEKEFNPVDLLNKEEKGIKFAIKNTDLIGLYSEALLSRIAANTKIKDNTKWNYGSYLVFSADDIVVAKGYERVPYKIKVYDVIEDYENIPLESYFKYDFKKDEKSLNCKGCACEDCPFKAKRKSYDERRVVYNGTWINSEEKVTIFNNFVKIGYDTFTIRNIKGVKFIQLDDYSLMEVREVNGVKALVEIN